MSFSWMSQFGTVIPRLMLIIDVVQLMSQFGTVIPRLMLPHFGYLLDTLHRHGEGGIG